MTTVSHDDNNAPDGGEELAMPNDVSPIDQPVSTDITSPTHTEDDAPFSLPPRFVYYEGTPYTLAGPYVGPRQRAPDFTATLWRGDEVHEVTSADILSNGGPCIFTTMHSVDTKLAIAHAVLLDTALQELPYDDYAACLITTDLPFTQNRFARETGLSTITLLSDYKTHSFGKNYGVLIKDHMVLTRSIYVVDKYGYITHRELVESINHHLDYAAAVEALYEATTA